MFSPENAVIILCGTRFPENVGMAARACANLGCRRLRLVNPERYDEFRAWPLATRIGRPILGDIRIFDDIPQAAADLAFLLGTSARFGGRRRAIHPSSLLKLDMGKNDNVKGDGLFGILFGPEDRGLSNAELSFCQEIINIPAVSGSSSFNVAQSVLIILYELSRNRQEARPVRTRGKGLDYIKIADLLRLEGEVKDLLLQCSILPENNPDYFFAQWHGILSRMDLKRHEYDALMGLCRTLKRKLGSR